MSVERNYNELSLENRTALTVYHTARELHPVVIFTPTESGAAAWRVARFKRVTRLVAFSLHEATCYTQVNLKTVVPTLPGKRVSRGTRWGHKLVR